MPVYYGRHRSFHSLTATVVGIVLQSPQHKQKGDRSISERIYTYSGIIVRSSLDGALQINHRHLPSPLSIPSSSLLLLLITCDILNFVLLIPAFVSHHKHTYLNPYSQQISTLLVAPEPQEESINSHRTRIFVLCFFQSPSWITSTTAPSHLILSSFESPSSLTQPGVVVVFVALLRLWWLWWSPVLHTCIRSVAPSGNYVATELKLHCVSSTTIIFSYTPTAEAVAIPVFVVNVITCLLLLLLR